MHLAARRVHAAGTSLAVRLADVAKEPTMTSYDRRTDESVPSATQSQASVSSALLWSATLGLFLVFVIAVLMTISGSPELPVGAIPP
jgi:hypothetical protein